MTNKKRAVLIYEKEIEGISICSIKLYELILETRKIVMYKNVVIIPALNPTEALVDYVESLIKGGMDKILLVNDGSNEKCKKIFDKLQKKDNVFVITHAKNLGKGRGLKNAFNYVLTHWSDEISGVITADSDGQHTVEDVIRVSEALDKQETPALILGTRDFDEEIVPFKSRYGNKITSKVFWLFYGVKVNDTQTGLRGIPKAYMYEYMDLEGERFEFEMNMLIYGAMHKHQFVQQTIRTVYFDNNSETHFRPVADSLKIYRLIFATFFKYIISSLSSSVIDLLAFYFITILLVAVKDSIAIVIATVIARVISSMYNFAINRAVVFKGKGKTIRHIIKYYTLCVTQMLLSAGLVVTVNSVFNGNKTIEKILVDSVLFLISYQIQRIWVFNER